MGPLELILGTRFLQWSGMKMLATMELRLASGLFSQGESLESQSIAPSVVW